ncbi:hypothetical protein [Sphingomonas baiyangensis]|uniref:Uncharacterized protein n=1 Tax=Sphingomonas baiyangensis TaxID=2572576 RepID=A0A4U1L696_9SPHN|nr:hypothetical protein [Sphingomonas baiyangensis]TKD51746.1 hypothetical protein FBR43_14030 [Sphingomonas baiyangensis]
MQDAPPSRTPMAGGALLAVSMLVGTGIGVALRQPSLGFLAGLGVGIALSVAIWLLDRRRG